MRNILVTGAAGYIGGLTVDALAERDDVGTLVAFDVREAKARDKVTAVTGDIVEGDLVAILKDHAIDTVVHLASILKAPVGAPEDLAYKVDVVGTRRLLEACVETGVSRIVVTTSGAAYGYSPENPMWLQEDMPLKPHDAFEYSKNKQMVEALLAKYRSEHPELKQLLLRPGTVIGEGTHSPVTEIFEGPAIVGVIGSDTPFVFIWDQDLVGILVEGATGEKEGIYNVAGDGALTSKEIARRLHKPYVPLPAPLLAGTLWLLKRLGKSAHGPETVDFIRYRPVLANDRLKNEFGYAPKASKDAFEIWARSVA